MLSYPNSAENASNAGAGSLTNQATVDLSTCLENRISSNVDWLSISSELPNRERLTEFFRDIFGDLAITIVDRSFKIADGVYHDKTIQTADSSVRGGLSLDGYGRYQVYLQISGRWWERLEPAESRQVGQKMAEYRCNCSRCDLRMDDWSHQLIPYEQMVKAAERGDVAGYKKYEVVGGGNVGEGGEIKLIGLGGRKSETYIRIYNHDWGEQLGQSLRMECEFKGKKAQVVFNLLTSVELDNKRDPNQEITEWIVSLVTGQHDYIDKSKGGTRSPKGINKQDCKRLPWWQQFLDQIGKGVKITVTRHKPTWQDTIDWLYYGVGKRLYLLWSELDSDQFEHLLTGIYCDAMKRMRDDDYRDGYQLSLEKHLLML